VVSGVTAVVPAGGRGARMGTDVPKQFLSLGGIPLLIHALRVFDAAACISEVIVVVPEDDRDHCCHEVLPLYHLKKVTQVIAGGPRRQDSVYNGLRAADPQSSIILVHDAVRPFLTVTLVNSVVDSADKHGAAIVAIPMRDTVKRVTSDQMIQKTLDREGLWLAQTPQAFRKALLEEAHHKGQSVGCEATDDAFLVEQLAHPVAIVTGTSENIKITRPEDLLMGEAILNAKMGRSCP